MTTRLCHSSSAALFGNICISSAPLDFADTAQSSSHSTDFLWESNLVFELLLKDFHILFVRPLQRWLGSTFESCWRRNVLAPTLRPLALRKSALLEIRLCLDPFIVPLDRWQTLPVLFGQVWSCTTMALWGMDGVRRLISSAQFQQTQHFASAESFWISFHQTSESLCVTLSVFHTSSDRFQAAAMRWLYMKALADSFCRGKLFFHDWRTLGFFFSFFGAVLRFLTAFLINIFLGRLLRLFKNQL